MLSFYDYLTSGTGFEQFELWVYQKLVYQEFKQEKEYYTEQDDKTEKETDFFLFDEFKTLNLVGEMFEDVAEH